MSKNILAKILCSMILLVILCNCKQTPQNYLDWEEINFNNKVSFLLPAGVAKNCSEKIAFGNCYVSNSFENKELMVVCEYLTNSCPSGISFEGLLNQSGTRGIEKEINGKKAIILRDYPNFYEYWKTKTIYTYYKVDFNAETTVYFFDGDNDKISLRLSFYDNGNSNYLVDRIINSTKVFE